MAFAKCSARCIAFLNCLYIGTYFVKTCTDFMENGLSEGSLVMWSAILVVNMISNMYLIMRVRRAIICTWFLLTSILFALRLFCMPYELHGTTYKTISIVINVYIGFSILLMIIVFSKLDNKSEMLNKVTVTPATGYKHKGKNVGNGVRFTNTRPTRSTHHYETDDYGVEDFNYTSIDLSTVNNILSYEDNCCTDNGREAGGGNDDCCADSGGGGGGSGGGDADCCADSGGGGGGFDSGGGDYDCGGGGDYDCGGGGDCGGYDS